MHCTFLPSQSTLLFHLVSSFFTLLSSRSSSPPSEKASPPLCATQDHPPPPSLPIPLVNLLACVRVCIAISSKSATAIRGRIRRVRALGPCGRSCVWSTYVPCTTTYDVHTGWKAPGVRGGRCSFWGGIVSWVAPDQHQICLFSHIWISSTKAFHIC